MNMSEQEYKEALGRAKRALKDGTLSPHTIALLKDIFRELKESEDEKIRKELIEHIKANQETPFVLFQKFSPEDVIAWLEKQGEQKSATWSEEDDRIYYSLLADIRTRLDGGTSTLESYYNEQIEWIKSLKQRIGG